MSQLSTTKILEIALHHVRSALAYDQGALIHSRHEGFHGTAALMEKQIEQRKAAIEIIEEAILNGGV